MKKLLKKKNGFTLIELLICLFIIGLMMLLIIPNIAHQREEPKKTSDAAIVKVFQNQKELYIYFSRITCFAQYSTCIIMPSSSCNSRF